MFADENPLLTLQLVIVDALKCLELTFLVVFVISSHDY